MKIRVQLFLDKETDHTIFSCIVTRPNFQKRSALKLVGRIIPEAKRSGIDDTFNQNSFNP
jgi:hypothetical protein